MKFFLFKNFLHLNYLEELVRPVPPVVSGAPRGHCWGVVRAGEIGRVKDFFTKSAYFQMYFHQREGLGEAYVC